MPSITSSEAFVRWEFKGHSLNSFSCYLPLIVVAINHPNKQFLLEALLVDPAACTTQPEVLGVLGNRCHSLLALLAVLSASPKTFIKMAGLCNIGALLDLSDDFQFAKLPLTAATFRPRKKDSRTGKTLQSTIACWCHAWIATAMLCNVFFNTLVLLNWIDSALVCIFPLCFVNKTSFRGHLYFSGFFTMARALRKFERSGALDDTSKLSAIDKFLRKCYKPSGCSKIHSQSPCLSWNFCQPWECSRNGVSLYDNDGRKAGPWRFGPWAISVFRLSAF